MKKGILAAAAALAVAISVPAFAGDSAPPFAEDEDAYFEEDKNTAPFFAEDEDRAYSFAEDTASPGIDQRQRNQQRRIQHGKRTGLISFREAVRLERMLAQIERLEQRFKADGTFTRSERVRIHEMLDRSGQRIRFAMHNGRIWR